MHENPDGDKYPCYKVVNAQGNLAANYAFGGLKFQRMRLEADGIIVNNDKVDLKQYQWSYEDDERLLRIIKMERYFDGTVELDTDFCPFTLTEANGSEQKSGYLIS